ncbi:MAG: RagB/SusD family nutrient uptake outer membrane protein [Bacteroidetes bacterium]|nr:RagB/SusD family nutrient uptake outer membrane protein [Bacteroidota bacterium]
MKKKIALIFSVALAVGLTSCKKDIKEINKENPGQFSDSDPVLMISGAQLANVLVNEGEAARMAGIFAGHHVGFDRQFVSYNDYVVNAGDFNNPWSNIYTEGVAQCRIIRAKAAKANNKQLNAVACITEANLLLTASALWGDIPNTEACVDGISSPKFDKMTAVHNAAIALLDSALVYGANHANYSGAYVGNHNWAQVANTLRARAYLHMKDYTKAAAAAANGIAAGKDLLANHSQATPGAWNLYYDFLDWNRSGYISASGSHMEKLLDSSAIFRNNAKTDESDRYAYYFNDAGYTPLDPNWDGIFGATANFPIVSYVENKLILAECAIRNNDATTAIGHLNSVRSDNATNIGGQYDDYVIGDFGPGQMVPGTTVNNAISKEILVEKYVSLYGQIEPWCDLRRTKNEIGVTPNKGNQLPQRFLVPQDEINANKNAPTAGSLFDALELWPQ